MISHKNGDKISRAYKRVWLTHPGFLKERDDVAGDEDISTIVINWINFTNMIKSRILNFGRSS